MWITPGVLPSSPAPSRAPRPAAGASRGRRGQEHAAFLLPAEWKEREFTLRWSDAANIDWGTVVLFGTGIIFGSLLESTGLAETLGNGAFDRLGLSSTFWITVFAVVLAILVSETTNNTASAAVVVPIIIPIAVAAGINPFVPALAGTFAAS